MGRESYNDLALSLGAAAAEPAIATSRSLAFSFVCSPLEAEVNSAGRPSSSDLNPVSVSQAGLSPTS